MKNELFISFLGVFVISLVFSVLVIAAAEDSLVSYYSFDNPNDVGKDYAGSFDLGGSGVSLVAGMGPGSVKKVVSKKPVHSGGVANNSSVKSIGERRVSGNGV